MTKVDVYTSTGLKFWRHPAQMNAFREGTGQTIISTHISPEGHCNLTCDYCSVTLRKTSDRLRMEDIKDYVLKLKTRGLKAAILTGGGEPTLYPQFNELVAWLAAQDLKLGLITNGTVTERVEDWSHFSWVRVSLNLIPNWTQRIKLPLEKLPSSCVVGCSFINTGRQLVDNKEGIVGLLDKLGARYLRVLPNCLLYNEDLGKEHKRIDELFGEVNDPRLFHQYKMHEVPPCTSCHQSYFRPYLSEVNGGLVFPCDSVVLNDCNKRFVEKYAICKPGEILDYLDGRIKAKFNPQVDCQGCVFVKNLRVLHEWKTTGVYKEVGPIEHEEFV